MAAGDMMRVAKVWDVAWDGDGFLVVGGTCCDMCGAGCNNSFSACNGKRCLLAGVPPISAFSGVVAAVAAVFATIAAAFNNFADAFASFLARFCNFSSCAACSETSFCSSHARSTGVGKKMFYCEILSRNNNKFVVLSVAQSIVCTEL